jgi:hypothetical protein
MKDPAFIEEAKRAKLDIDPVSGSALAKIAADILSSPQPIKDRLASIIIVKERR